ncbi:isoleucine--tRNA ligase [Bacillus sp. UMB0728]|uniref:isoleucine--tRNA ligase n=1 Tax=Bacillus sp. UMB0728 TaxID=2066052 RepID=UPI000C78B3F8|nr:isoleucine--tRNA ligase [Bacillus sp. UMB0728]PLR74483.1 isoleucine--tRNA ligase [Bacillus sp. UMB0728]
MESTQSRENRIREYWRAENIFARSVSNRAGKTPFVFYEGPPTANGLPHAGHALGRTYKDLTARYWTMKGRQVIRKAGWDTHGLPVELGVEKALGISGKKEIEEYGVGAFIEKCRESVFQYEKQWREFTEQLGYWTDMDEPYMTLSNEYIESVWHILGTIHEKGLLYKGHRVSPYCPSCQTSLSSHETAQGYKDVKDLSATVTFRLKGRENEYLLGWTTTPWTLPANVALAVHPQVRYARVKNGDKIYIAAENRVAALFQSFDEILETLEGKEIAGWEYEPPFQADGLEGAHRVIAAEFVTENSGTGIVHLAPAYGEDDYRAIKENGLPFINIVDSKGCYTDEFPPLAGRFVKDCDVDILKMLGSKDLLFHKEKYEHSYPFCWRCDSPLLYYAADSWFIKTSSLKEKFLELNSQAEWHPSHMKNGRFGNFLEGLVDWNISRSRYWGTPLNVWVCENCGAEKAPKSFQELQELSEANGKLTDYHKPYVDAVKIPCQDCDGYMARTPEVIDVWFDSGSMPYAQLHYPFEHKEEFSRLFPADAVIEGVDQTRGWFYSLLAVSVLYKGQLPYKNVLALEHVLDENGQKMSKSKGNALDPAKLITEFGADALRWALVEDSSPWKPKKFSGKNAAEAKSKLVDSLASIHHFYSLYSTIDHFEPDSSQTSGNIMDRWILSRLHSVIETVNKEMGSYQATNAARAAGTLIEEVSNWYIRRNRERFWAKGMEDDKISAFQTLYTLLDNISRMLAPFVPFIAESVYLDLTGRSVHLEDYPEAETALIDRELEDNMVEVMDLVELGRSIRHSKQLKTKQPLAEMLVQCSKEKEEKLKAFSRILKEELNVKDISWAESLQDKYFCRLKLNFKAAGKKYGKNANLVHQSLQQLSETDIRQLLETGSLVLQAGNELLKVENSDTTVEKLPKKGYAESSGRNMTVLLKTDLTEELKREGYVRDFIRGIQDLRKKLELPIDKRVNLQIDTTSEAEGILRGFEDLLYANIVLEGIAFKPLQAPMLKGRLGGELIAVSLT